MGLAPVIILLALALILAFYLRKPKPLPRAVEKMHSRPILYGTMRCPYTAKMVDALNKEGAMHMFVFVDTSTPKGAQMLEAAGGEGVPHFEHNGRVATGFMPVSTLMKKLNIV